MSRGKDYRSDLLADLKNDRAYAAEYLSAALADSTEAFLVALRDVAEAQRGVAAIAKVAQLNRESLYRVFSARGNPRLQTLHSILEALGLRLSIQSRAPRSATRRASARRVRAAGARRIP